VVFAIIEVGKLKHPFSTFVQLDRTTTATLRTASGTVVPAKVRPHKIGHWYGIENKLSHLIAVGHKANTSHRFETKHHHFSGGGVDPATEPELCWRLLHRH
jgi:hypothetical protein